MVHAVRLTDRWEYKRDRILPQFATTWKTLQMNRERNQSSSVELQQIRLEQRISSLHRRVKGLQHCQSRGCLDNELNSSVISIRRALDNATSFRESETLNDIQALLKDASIEQKLENLIKNGSIRPEFFHCDELRNGGPANIVQILKKYESSLKKIISLWSSPAVGNLNNSTSVLPSNHAFPPNLALDREEGQCLSRVTNSIQSHLYALQSDYDSDATESSSGGESCEEDEDAMIHGEVKSSGRFRHWPLENRASWQWWTERGWLGSRWAWIQFQMADLEYKIRQHVDLHKQLRLRKTCTSLSSSSFPSTYNGKVTANSTVNSTCDGNKPNNEDLGTSSAEGCARTRPVDISFRRRVIRTSGMFRWNRKTLVRSTVNCGCFPPYSSCVMCGGRADRKETVQTRSQTKNISNSILEPAYHPHLSSRIKGIGLNRKLEAFWCAPNPVQPIVQWFPQPKTIITLLPNKRENDSIYAKETTSPFDSQSSMDKQPRRQSLGPFLSKRRRSAANSRRISTIKRAKRMKRDSSGSIGSSGNFASSMGLDDNECEAGKVGSRRTTDQQSTFDIDNIIIDPKVAAVTRVEKIQYKEIQTPGWRFCELQAETRPPPEENGEDEDEDISDAAFERRHETKESEEKKRFIPILFRDFHSSTRRSVGSIV